MAYAPPHSARQFNVVIPRADRHTQQKKQVLSIIPVMAIGLIATLCILHTAQWKGKTTVLFGAGEEAAEAHAIAKAAALGKDAVSAKLPPVSKDIMEEVEKAEKEQQGEMNVEKQFAMGEDSVSSDGHNGDLRKKAVSKKALHAQGLIQKSVAVHKKLAAKPAMVKASAKKLALHHIANNNVRAHLIKHKL
ncbi:hypothetical protein GUITHDRAFT_131528 [Guillardia theta CCMP2712]|uniref:Uncharacterized protein n=1 Tax=Guillardia theta (strain CCMP2712) TaxID=905079 RepID=L1K4C1_GUITC|nr:hypothetical protein GUITHDRAFT_131528 [Guillardia theta CCMP2712]EKX55290.1 hypothetical protein GUITHDRAFT_131528 [Guillardia theta CCMP2712]|eukprot:XP_005842270.1 hypothetical protein GUITHDRAFT_131528 [Guillardia theta CCMP2712]